MHSRSSGTAAGDAGELGAWGQPLDPLTEVLQDLRLSGSFYCRTELRAPWGLEIPARPFASFHFVAEGRSWLLGAGAPLELAQGDLVLLPHGRGHTLADAPGRRGQRIDALAHEAIGPNASILRHGGKGDRTLLVCGGVRFSGAALHPLVDLLPDRIHVRARSSAQQRLLGVMLEAMGAEALAPRPGSATVLTRLSDILVIHAVRSWLDDAPVGWLGALRDPRVGRALALIHKSPQAPWSVGSLARAVHLSRSVFAARFGALVGMPPIEYLTRWRMHLAAGWLRDEPLGLGEVASRVGYQSEPAFSRAFKRLLGLPPATYRRQAERPRP